MYTKKTSLLLAFLIMGSPIVNVYADSINNVEDSKIESISDVEEEKGGNLGEVDDLENIDKPIEEDDIKILKDDKIVSDIAELLDQNYSLLEVKDIKIKLVKLKELKTTILTLENNELYTEDVKHIDEKVIELELLITEKIDMVDKAEKEKLSIAKIKTDTKINLQDKKIYLLLPSLPNYKVKYSVIGNDAIIKEGVSSEQRIDLPDVSKETKYKITLEVYSIKTDNLLETIEVEQVFKDAEKPKIESIYVKNDKVYVEYKDNYKLDNKPLGYRVGRDKNYKFTDRDYFELDGEDKVEIIVRDLFGNETTESFRAKSKNEVIKGDVSNKVKKDIENSKVDKFNKIKNLVAIESNAEIDLYDIFEDFLDDTFSSRQLKRLKVDSSIKLKDGYKLKTSKKGLHEFVFYDKDDDEDVNLYVYIKDSKSKDSDHRVRGVKLKKDIKEVSDFEIQLKDLIDVEFYRGSNMKDKDKDNKINNLIVKVDGLDYVYTIKDKVKLKEDKLNEIIILDIEEDRSFNIEIKHNSKAKESKPVNTTVKVPDTSAFVKQYSDVESSFWAANDITRLSKLKLIKGYPGGQYKPMESMTVREFLTLYGRFLNIVSEKDKRPVKNTVTVKIQGNQWGVSEMSNVYSRISTSKLKTFKTTDINRKIKREEVAFIIGNTLNLNNPGVKSSLNDVSGSAYEQEINALYNDKKIKGFPDNSFKPASNVTRAEIASFISNLF